MSPVPFLTSVSFMGGRGWLTKRSAEISLGEVSPGLQNELAHYPWSLDQEDVPPYTAVRWTFTAPPCSPADIWKQKWESEGERWGLSGINDINKQLKGSSNEHTRFRSSILSAELIR